MLGDSEEEAEGEAPDTVNLTKHTARLYRELENNGRIVVLEIKQEEITEDSKQGEKISCKRRPNDSRSIEKRLIDEEGITKLTA